MPGSPERAPELLLLSVAAGSLDALSYLAGHAFTANMTGNTVFLGLSIFSRERDHLLPSAIALAAFLAGVAVAAFLLTRRREQSSAAADLRYGLSLELPLLVLFAGLWLAGAPTAALLTSAAAALGIQSVAVRRLKISGVVTTFITGTLTTAVVQALSRTPEATETKQEHSTFLVVMFLAYVAAAASGALLFAYWRTGACALPVAAAALAYLTARRS